MFYDSVPLGAGYLRHPQRPRPPVNFILRYRGPLPAKQQGTTLLKARIRDYIHPQLEQLCHREPYFRPATGQGRMQPPVRKGGWLRSDGSPFYEYCLKGTYYVPLVHSGLYLVCQLDITWLRRDVVLGVGGILQGGDLDNRLKTLLDGLRMPREEGDVRGLPDGAERRCYCLMEDDRLVTKFSVSTYDLLEPRQEGERAEDVDLLINVAVKSTNELLYPGSAHLA